MQASHALAAAARDLVGTPFRLQGREPASGLDCIGVVIVSLAQVRIELALPADYRPRRRSFAIPETALASAGLSRTTGASPQPGDILLLRTAPAQVHAAIAINAGEIVHAHAGLGRVVRTPLPDQWALLAAWRLTPDGEPKWQP